MSDFPRSPSGAHVYTRILARLNGRTACLPSREVSRCYVRVIEKEQRISPRHTTEGTKYLTEAYYRRSKVSY
jgi:hypothetical protein